MRPGRAAAWPGPQTSVTFKLRTVPCGMTESQAPGGPAPVTVTDGPAQPGPPAAGGGPGGKRLSLSPAGPGPGPHGHCQ